MGLEKVIHLPQIGMYQFEVHVEPGGARQGAIPMVKLRSPPYTRAVA